MFFNFKFRHFLTNPDNLADQLKSSSIRGLGIRVFFVFLIGVALFAIRELWGMNTETITPLLSTMTTADYTIARYASLVGTFIWSLIYMSFHFFAFAYVLNLVTDIPYKKILPLQLLVTGLLLIEKALVFIVFAVQGEVASVSFLSFGPLAMTFLDIPFFIFFFNQLTITTALIILLQFRFIIAYTGITEKKRLVLVLVGIHTLMAAMVAAVGFIPMEGLFNFFIGGVGNK